MGKKIFDRATDAAPEPQPEEPQAEHTTRAAQLEKLLAEAERKAAMAEVKAASPRHD